MQSAEWAPLWPAQLNLPGLTVADFKGGDAWASRALRGSSYVSWARAAGAVTELSQIQLSPPAASAEPRAPGVPARLGRAAALARLPAGPGPRGRLALFPSLPVAYVTLDKSLEGQ